MFDIENFFFQEQSSCENKILCCHLNRSSQGGPDDRVQTTRGAETEAAAEKLPDQHKPAAAGDGVDRSGAAVPLSRRPARIPLLGQVLLPHLPPRPAWPRLGKGGGDWWQEMSSVFFQNYLNFVIQWFILHWL